MIKRLILYAVNKENDTIRVHLIRNDSGYGVFTALRTKQTEDADMIFGNILEFEDVNDPNEWRERVKRCVALLVAGKLTNRVERLSQSYGQYSFARKEAINEFMRLLPKDRFRPDCWETVGWCDPDTFEARRIKAREEEDDVFFR